MPDEQTLTTETPNPEQAGTIDEAAEAVSGGLSGDATSKVEDESTAETVGAENGADGGEDETTSTLSHEDALAALKKVRKEAADNRVKAKQFEDALKAAKTPEDIAAAIEARDAEHAQEAEKTATEIRDLRVKNAALTHGLPPELADLLKGDTPEELDAHAKALAKFAPSTNTGDPHLTGGLDPSDDEPVYDVAAAREAARKARRGR